MSALIPYSPLISILISFGRFKTKEEPVNRTNDLRIDCRQCGEPSIAKASCIRCIGESIVRFGEPERIILRSGVEREFSQETVELLRRISDAFCRTSVGMTGRRCSGCVLSQESLENEKWADLSFENFDELIDRLGKVFLECSQCQNCISDAQRYFGILKDRLEGLSKDAAVAAYRIVGV